MPRATRRLFLQLGGAAVAGTIGALAPARAAYTPDDTFVLLRRRWREVTAGPPPDPGARPYQALVRAAARYRDTMAPGPSSLWPDQPFPSYQATPRRLRIMAQAYAMRGAPELARAVAEGVEHYVRHVYADGAEATGNWWHWWIGMPRRCSTRPC